MLPLPFSKCNNNHSPLIRLWLTRRSQPRGLPAVHHLLAPGEQEPHWLAEPAALRREHHSGRDTIPCCAPQRAMCSPSTACATRVHTPAFEPSRTFALRIRNGHLGIIIRHALITCILISSIPITVCIFIDSVCCFLSGSTFNQSTQYQRQKTADYTHITLLKCHQRKSCYLL